MRVRVRMRIDVVWSHIWWEKAIVHVDKHNTFSQNSAIHKPLASRAVQVSVVVQAI